MSEQTLKLILEFVMAFVSTLGFALLFRMKYRFLPIAALGGTFTYGVYVVVAALGDSLLLAAVASAFFMTLLSELFARIGKAPAIIFLLPFAISIVPGSYLYYTMSCLLQNDPAYAYYLKATLQVGIGIAVGISVAMVCVGVFLRLYQLIKHKKTAQ